MFDRIKNRTGLTRTKKVKARTEKGQSLVEVAIFAPLLIFLLLGVFEVGNALRGYLVLVNMNREITRFAVRPGYLDFSTQADVTTSYTRVFDWIGTALVDQLPLDFAEVDEDGNGFADGNATMIISHLVVDTGLPCEDINSDPEDCDCDAFVDAYNNGTTYSNDFTLDDIYIHPAMEGHAFQAERFGPETTVTGPKATRLNYEAMVKELAASNNKFNCEIMKKGGIPSANNIIVTEVFHDQPQLFGFPFISNPFTDPVPLYTHTSMRLISGARDLLTNIDTVGPVCFSFPTTMRRSVIETAVPGQRVDILDGAGPSDFGWLTWNPGEDDENYLNNEWKYPQMSVNDYTDPSEHGDHSLNIGDYVTTLNGAVNSSDTRDILEGYVGKLLIIPVWDDINADGFMEFDNPNAPPPRVDAYKVWKFVTVRIDQEDDIQITPHKNIFATYVGSPDICQ